MGKVLIIPGVSVSVVKEPPRLGQIGPQWTIAASKDSVTGHNTALKG